MNRLLIGVMMALAAVGVVLVAAYTVISIRSVPTSPALNPAAQSGGSEVTTEGEGLEGVPGLKSVTVAVGVGRSTTQLDVTLSPLEVVEDSRCPAGVACIWEGTLEARVKVTSGSESAEEKFSLGETVATEGRAITLLRAEPAALEGGKIPQSSYKLVFKIEKQE